MLAILLACGGAALLHGFFMVVRTRWPDNYFSLTSQIEYRTSRGRFAYAIFRFSPVLAVFTLVAVTSQRTGTNTTLALTSLALLHVADTTGRLIASEIQAKLAGKPVNGSRTVLGLAITAPIAALAVIVGLFADNLSPLVPGADKFVESLWTAAVTAIATALVLQSTRKSTDLPDIVRIEMSRLTSLGLTAEVQHAAMHERVAPDFLTAIMITENLQRPGWFRSLERVISLFSRTGTYGVMQVRSNQPLSDADSIRRTAESFRGYVPEYGTSGPIEPYLRAAFYKHNPSNSFIDMAVEIYGELAPPPHSATQAKAADGRPIVEILSIEQEGDSWILSGTASVHEGNLMWRHADGADPGSGSVSVTTGSPGRGTWSLRVPLRMREVAVGEPQEADHLQEDPARWTTATTHYVY